MSLFNQIYFASQITIFKNIATQCGPRELVAVILPEKFAQNCGNETKVENFKIDR